MKKLNLINLFPFVLVFICSLNVLFAQTQFSLHEIVPSGDGATILLVDDLDQDGDLDIVTGDSNNNRISIYRNIGGSYEREQSINFDGAVNFIRSCDIDDDGDLDIILSFGWWSPSEVIWLRNIGQSYQVQVITSTIFAPRSGVVMDADGDGLPDIIVAGETAQNVGMIRYEYVSGIIFSNDTIVPSSVSIDELWAEDLDNDGDMDLICTSNDFSGIIWYENDGSANFTYHELAATTLPVRIAVGDIDSDGDMDIIGAWASSGQHIFSWFENDGNQNFTEIVITSTIENIKSIATSDIDNDGDLDISLVSYVNGGISRISWLENDGSQNFSINDLQLYSNSPRFVQVIDIDQDGDKDMVAAYSEAMMIYQNDGAQQYSLRHVDNSLNWALEVNVADMDNDGDQDAVSFSLLDSKATLFENIGNGNFDTKPISYMMKSRHKPGLADINGDGLTDIIASWQNDLYWYKNMGDGTFDPIFPIASNESYMFKDVDTADLDGDGDVDVLIAKDDYGGGSIGWIKWAENDGNGQFTLHSLRTANRGTSVDAVDLDQDGDMDVLGAFFVSDFIAWYENDGSGAFTEHYVVTGLDVFDAEPGDIDGDGDIDILTHSVYDGRVLWYENDGTQQFSQHTISGNLGGPGRMTLADIDNDQDLDAIVCATIDNEMVFFVNDGSGNFVEYLVEDGLGRPTSIAVADIDNDGAMDIISTWPESGLYWHENLLPTSISEYNFSAEQLLLKNYPNPFSERTTIRFKIPANGDVRLTVMGLGGKEIATIFDGTLGQGEYQAEFFVEDLRAGVYLYRLEVDGMDVTKKMTIIR